MDAYSEIPLYPFTQWSMDLISMPSSKRGNDLIVLREFGKVDF